MATHVQNQVLGKGKIYLDRFAAGTTTKTGERYIGNTPQLSVTTEATTLDHFDSDSGIKQKDNSVALETTRSGQLITDNIEPDNVALFFFGSTLAIADAGGAVTGESLGAVKKNNYYQLGVSPSAPAGIRKIQSSGLAVKVGAATKTITTDYEVDLDLGRIYIVPGGSIADGDVVTVDYTRLASARTQIISGATPVECALRFISANPAGNQLDYYFPYVKISPNGDYELKGDEWQQIPLSLEILKLGSLEAIYMDGRPV